MKLNSRKRRKSKSKSIELKSKRVKRQEEDEFIQKKQNLEELNQDKMENRVIKGLVKNSCTNSSIPVEDVEVKFPFEHPYQSQINIIRDVSRAVLNNFNALIESPTGTGKTLAILSAVCSILKEDRRRYWLGDVKRPMSTVIYCTRTHSQISQVMREIREKLPYDIRAVPYASRQLLCIYDDVKEKYTGSALNHACKKVRSGLKKKIVAPKRGCCSSTPSKSEGGIFDDSSGKSSKKKGVNDDDIEDIGKITRCPFFPVTKKNKSQGILDQSIDSSKSSASKAASDSFVKISKFIPWKSYAVEDYVKIGEIRKVCPYYLTRLRTNMNIIYPSFNFNYIN